MQLIPLIIEPDPEDEDCADVMVDGMVRDCPRRFLVDTGAARTALIADDVTSSLPKIGAHRSTGVFASSEARLVELPSISIGSVVKSALVVEIVEADQPGARNLLGMDVLKDLRCQFRFRESTLAIGGSGGERASLDLDDAHHPYVDVHWDEVTAQAVWDSGAGITIVDEGFRRRNAHLFAAAGVSFGTDSTGQRAETPMYLASDTVIGGVRFTPHKVAAVDLSSANAALDKPMDLILGYTTLRQADWSFDFAARRWSVDR